MFVRHFSSSSSFSVDMFSSANGLDSTSIGWHTNCVQRDAGVLHRSPSDFIELLVKGRQWYDSRLGKIPVSDITWHTRNIIFTLVSLFNWKHVFHFLASISTETVINNPAYKSTMRLTICNVQRHDYGTYKCVAKNPRGETDGTIRLYCKFLIGKRKFLTFHTQADDNINVLRVIKN